MGIIVLGTLISLGFGGAMIFIMRSRLASVRGGLEQLEDERTVREQIEKDIRALYEKMVPIPKVRELVKELMVLQESLKAERGRITITQAELETVETRLRELEEIERELEASGMETKEELNILEKKHRELRQANEQLKARVLKVSEQLQATLAELESSAQIQEQVTTMTSQLTMAEEKIDTLILQIEIGNEQYFTLKRRYDALDIEYAQLYEKFSESEAMSGGGAG